MEASVSSLKLMIRWYYLLILVGMFAAIILHGKPSDVPTDTQFRTLASTVNLLLGIALAGGTAAMATVQFWKHLFFPRAAFHRRELLSFFGSSVVVDILTLKSQDAKSDESRETLLDRLLRSHPIEYLLDSPTEVLMAQLRSAADYAILNPEQFHNGLAALTGPSGIEIARRYEDLRSKERLRREPNIPEESGQDLLIQIRFLVEQRLNLAHITLRDRWRRQIRFVASMVAAAIGMLVAASSDLSDTAKLCIIFASAVWGGFFAWFVRDAIAAIEQQRS